ncbi:hypothetical protein [Mycolicibacterium septicum]|uniref:hypothetical protein n=1 Tax=Mycolicibacterium septicum TaxID=98668 RepID=UPI00235FA33B|nr:hypothetical protein [Mycolicibacterium septicum]
MSERLFDGWKVDVEYPTLFRVDRIVRVDPNQVFPPCDRRKDELPLWIKSFGAHLDTSMLARQLAWLRRSDGSWLAFVELPVTSANGASQLTMELWLPAAALSAE